MWVILRLFCYLLACPASRCRRACVSRMLLSLIFFFFFLTASLETNYLRKYWTDLHRIIGYGSAWSVWPSFPHRSRDAATVTDVWVNRRKLAYPPSFGALAFHNGWEERATLRHLDYVTLIDANVRVAPCGRKKNHNRPTSNLNIGCLPFEHS